MIFGNHLYNHAFKVYQYIHIDHSNPMRHTAGLHMPEGPVVLLDEERVQKLYRRTRRRPSGLVNTSHRSGAWDKYTIFKK